MKPLFRIAVVDDHKLFRNGIISLLSEFQDIEVVFDAANGMKLISGLKKHTIDTVLLDIQMPVMNGIETTIYLQKNYPTINVILLSMYYTKQLIENMKSVGVSNFFQKNQDIEDIVQAIKNPLLNHSLPKALGQQPNLLSEIAPDIKLSEREIEIIRLMSQELTNKEIAEKLCLSIRTIDGHKERIIHKTKAKNSVGIVMFALKYNLLND